MAYDPRQRSTPVPVRDLKGYGEFNPDEEPSNILDSDALRPPDVVTMDDINVKALRDEVLAELEALQRKPEVEEDEIVLPEPRPLWHYGVLLGFGLSLILAATVTGLGGLAVKSAEDQTLSARTAFVTTVTNEAVVVHELGDLGADRAQLVQHHKALLHGEPSEAVQLASALVDAAELQLETVQSDSTGFRVAVTRVQRMQTARLRMEQQELAWKAAADTLPGKAATALRLAHAP